MRCRPFVKTFHIRMFVLRPIVLSVVIVLGVYASIRMERHDRKRFVNHYHAIHVKSALICCFKCAREEGTCFGVNFLANGSTCEFFGRDRTYVHEEGWLAYHFTSKNICLFRYLIRTQVEHWLEYITVVIPLTSVPGFLSTSSFIP